MLKNKRGQFFILSAVILALILTSLTSIYNYSNTAEEPQGLYDLTENIKNEGFEVIDYSLYNSKDAQTVLSTYTNNISEYLLNSEPDAEFFFVYGNLTAIKIEDYTIEGVSIPSIISLSVGGSSFVKSTATATSKDYRIIYNKTMNLNNDKSINITIKDKSYNITINPGQNFIIVMKKTYKNNTYLDLR